MTTQWFVEHGKLRYGEPKVGRPPPANYVPPEWKTCPDHQWIKLFLQDVEAYERRLKLGPDAKRDLCIR